MFAKKLIYCLQNRRFKQFVLKTKKDFKMLNIYLSFAASIYSPYLKFILSSIYTKTRIDGYIAPRSQRTEARGDLIRVT